MTSKREVSGGEEDSSESHAGTDTSCEHDEHSGGLDSMLLIKQCVVGIEPFSPCFDNLVLAQHFCFTLNCL